MRILKIEPEHKPERADIPDTLEAMQKVVGGYIQAVYPFDLQRRRKTEWPSATGESKGRKPIERAEFSAVVRQWRAGEITATEAMKRLDMTSSTFYRNVRICGKVT